MAEAHRDFDVTGKEEFERPEIDTDGNLSCTE
jgi:hypothetical protein